MDNAVVSKVTSVPSFFGSGTTPEVTQIYVSMVSKCILPEQRPQ